MDGEERNASLPILGSHEIFPRTDPTGPRNPVASQMWPRGRCPWPLDPSKVPRTRRGKERMTQRRKKQKNLQQIWQFRVVRSYGVPCNPTLGVARPIVWPYEEVRVKSRTGLGR